MAVSLKHLVLELNNLVMIVGNGVGCDPVPGGDNVKAELPHSLGQVTSFLHTEEDGVIVCVLVVRDFLDQEKVSRALETVLLSPSWVGVRTTFGLAVFQPDTSDMLAPILALRCPL